MAFTRVHHVGMIVGDFQEAHRVYVRGFGLAVDQRHSPWPDGRPGSFDDVLTLEFPIGELFLEVSRPRDPQSPAGRFLAERNGVGGMHHVALASTDLPRDVAMLRRRGVRLLDGGGADAVFLDPRTTLGLFIEVTPTDEYYPHPLYRGSGLAMGMGHVGIAARSVDEVRGLFGGVFGLAEDTSARRGGDAARTRRTGPPRPADDDVSIVEFPLGGTVLEVSVPNDDVSGTARFVAQRGALGAAYHHICPFAPDVHAFMERGVQVGLQQIGSIPPRESGERAVGWFHPRSALGTLIEVWNRPPSGL